MYVDVKGAPPLKGNFNKGVNPFFLKKKIRYSFLISYTKLSRLQTTTKLISFDFILFHFISFLHCFRGIFYG